MTKATTTDKDRRQRRHMLWLWPASLVIHILLIAILAWTGLLSVKMIFDKKEQKAKAEKAAKAAFNSRLDKVLVKNAGFDADVSLEEVFPNQLF